MPPRGVKSAKRGRQYEHIKASAKKRGRSTKRAKEIAARTVNKQRREAGQTKSTSRKRSSAKKAASGSRKRSSSRSRKSSTSRKSSAARKSSTSRKKR